MKLVNDSQTEWLQKGGSTEALTFIENVVGQLHTKALNEGIVHKAATEEVATEVATEEVVAETIVEDVEAIADEVVEAVTEAVAPVATETKAVTQVDFAAVLAETIFAAQKQYHESVIAPLLVEIKSLKDALTQTEVKSNGLFSFDMSSLLPSAAVASRIQKEFGAKTTTEIKGEPVVATAITKKEVATVPADGNLLGSFLS